MKQLKFNENLVPLILNNQKTTTWRFFDDKKLSINDKVEFINSKTGKVFAKAIFLNVYEKPVSELNKEDREGHEDIVTGETLLEHFKTLYNKDISSSDLIKVIKFKLI